MLNVFNNKKIRILLIILIAVCALILRLYYSFHIPETFANGLGTHGDAHLYHKIAYNLYKGRGFSGTDNGEAYGIAQKNGTIRYEPEIVRGPVYPLFISFIYKFFCDPRDMESVNTWYRNWDKVRVAQCILDTITCLWVFFIVRLIIPESVWPAIISAGLQGVNLYTIYYTKAIMTESVTAFLMTTMMLLYLMALTKKEKKWWIPPGLAFGMVVLSRPEYSLFIFILVALIILVNRNSMSAAIKQSIIFIISAVIIISPWTLRNYLIFKEPILVAESGMGQGIFVSTFTSKATFLGEGKYPDEVFNDASEKEKFEAMFKEYVRTFHAGISSNKAHDDAFLEKALDIISKNPVKVLRIWISRMPTLWYFNYIQEYNAIIEPSGYFLVFYFVFAFFAFFNLNRQKRIFMAPMLLLCFYLSLIFIPMNAIPRYSIPTIPGIISLSGIGIWSVISKLIKLLHTRG